MTWPPDVPDYPIKKPREIENIERMPPEILNSMRKVEIDEKIGDAADSLAKSYFDSYKEKGSLSECSLIVSGAQKQTGSSIGGNLGMSMVAESKEKAEEACKEYYPDHPFPNEI